jgi:adenylate kinase family enzyme
MEIALAVLSLLLLSFCIAYYKSQQQLSMIKQAMMNLVLELPETKTEDIDVHKENFIKFLSESREWAFDYIEDFQGTLQKFLDEVQPQLDYYNKYGIVVDGMIPPEEAPK